MSAPSPDLLLQCRDPALLCADVAKIQRVAKRLTKALAAGAEFGPRTKVAVLSSFLTDFLADVLALCLFRRGIVADIFKAPYGALMTEVLGNGATLAARPDVVLLLPTHRDLLHTPELGCSAAAADAAALKEASAWRLLWERLRMPIVQLGFDPPPYRALAELDGYVPGGRLHHVRRVNQALATDMPARVMLVDAEALATRLGSTTWHDPRLYQMCKQPFGAIAVSEVADTLAAAVASLLGRGRKVLVLDLDDTLWGGVVGDVGVEGLTLGPETAEGEAFVALQTYVRTLAQRGVILAVCSKNQDEAARLPFREHSAMVLRENDIACFVANFDDKVTNLRRIAESVNLGLDSFVLVDNNPVERAWVSRELPEVLVVDLPDDPAGYCEAIERSKVFPMGRLTAEDLTRNSSYLARAGVVRAQAASNDIDAFLAGLEARAVVEPATRASLDRIVQLIAKTNQFKLNPTSFTPEEIEDNAEGVIALRLVDRLQDYGVVAIAVTEESANELVVRNWVMSCRVFSRRLEYVMLELLCQRAAGHGDARISLTYLPSSRNALVKDVLAGLGFMPDGTAGRYVTKTADRVGLPRHHMKIIAQGM